MIQHNNCYIWWSAPRQGIFPQVAHIVSVPLTFLLFHLTGLHLQYE